MIVKNIIGHISRAGKNWNPVAQWARTFQSSVVSAELLLAQYLCNVRALSTTSFNSLLSSSCSLKFWQRLISLAHQDFFTHSLSWHVIFSWFNGGHCRVVCDFINLHVDSKASYTWCHLTEPLLHLDCEDNQVDYSRHSWKESNGRPLPVLLPWFNLILCSIHWPKCLKCSTVLGTSWFCSLSTSIQLAEMPHEKYGEKARESKRTPVIPV